MADPRAQKGMGRGLAAILAAAPREEPEELRQVPVELIAPNPHQPRHRFGEDALLGLADSIRARGVIQPVLLRPLPDGRFELIAGERRWRAAQLAELPSVPAVIRHDDDAASIELALIENMVREDLNPVEAARACLALVEELGLTREEVGLRVGRSRVSVSNLLRLLDLPDDALTLIEDGHLSEGHGRALLLAADHDARRRLARVAAAEGWSVRELEARARAAADAGDGAGAPSRPSRERVVHPDQAEAVTRIADALGAALSADVSVKPAGFGYAVTLRFASLEEALAYAEARTTRP
ncbi:ParB/RepB/Spo0J family partition protein [Conexibacter sp. DBS9H8]|uniref:ParB/RepB/Spo0J family partition protein n=1 Tax=Conexibacter sp. DBS9H8 TaxID=2937801 RepID=UPI00200E7906|nr:ParB/RepB/Spo0J family partition protein [Conexibacter sp. DBS9H8]